MTIQPKIWGSPDGPGHRSTYIPYEYSNSFESALWNPLFWHTFFTNYWWTCFIIIGIYISTIYLLQRYMRNRPAFVLRKPLILWNSGLAIFSMIASYRFAEEALYVYKHATFQEAICWSINPHSPAAFWGCLFTLSKVAELVDTVFLVLRKRPLIFLHWYHHAIVMVYTWHSAMGLTASGRWFIMMNYAVHSVMYSYFALTSMGFKIPRFLAALVTMFQTTQMLVGIYISVSVAEVKISKPDFPCQQTAKNLGLCFFIYFTFAFLFLRFFIQTYLLKTKSGKEKTTKQH